MEYHAEESYHLNIKVEADRAKAVNRRRGGAAALRALNQEAMSAADSSTSAMNAKSSATVDQDEGEEDEESKDKPDSLNVVDIVGHPPESAVGVGSPADTSSSEEPPLALGKIVASRVNGSVTSRTAPDSAQLHPPSGSVRVPSSPTPSPPAPAYAQLQQQQQPQQHLPGGQPPQQSSPLLASPTIPSGSAAPSSATSTRAIPSSRPAGRVSLSKLSYISLLT